MAFLWSSLIFVGAAALAALVFEQGSLAELADRASVAPAESHVGPSVSQRAAGRI